MVNQMRIGMGVIGVLLILFLVIVYSRITGAKPVLEIRPTESPVPAGLADPPTLKQPTIVKDDNSMDLPQEAFNPPVDPPNLPSGPNPGALIPRMAPFENSQTQRWPVLSSGDS